MAVPTARDLIDYLKLEPLPVEGGYFRRYYCGTEMVDVPVAAGINEPRPTGTAIYFLLTPEKNCFSEIHSLPFDEIYHFYLGDPVDLLLLQPGGTSEHVLLGSDILAGQEVQQIAPAHTWQGSRLHPGGEFALLGTTMAPGYDFADYVAGKRSGLIEEFPNQAELITALTRANN